MKRILSILLTVVLVLSMLVSCDIPFFGNKTEEADINEAAKIVKDMYKDFNGASIPDGKELIAQVKVGQTVFKVQWASDNDKVTFKYENNFCYVQVSKDITENAEYTLTATITSEGGQSATLTFKPMINVASTFGMITNPVAGTAYKLALLHRNEGGVVYFDGNNYNNYAWYFSYTDDVNLAVDVYLEAVEGVEGGYRLYFDKDGVKTYVVAFPRDGDTTKGTLKFDTVVPSEYFTFSTEYNTLVYTSVTGQQFYMGSSGTYKSISCSEISYVTSDTSYPVRLYGAGGVEEKLPEQQLPEVPENYTSQDIVNALYQLKPGQTLEGPYEFTGVITSIKYAYDPAYNNISVNIVVDGMTDKPILCYRLNDGKDLKVGDTITVFAGLTNYNGTYETTSGGVIREIVPGTGENPGTGNNPGTDNPPSTGSAILNLEGNANLVSGSAAQNIFAANGITLTNDKASSTSDLTVQASYAQRFYAGSTVKIEYTGMTKIVLTLDTYSDGKYLKGFDGMTVEGATITRDNDVVTITFAAPTNVFTSTTLPSQVRCLKVEVFTGEVENPDTHEHNFVDGKCECGAEDPNYQPPSGGETPEAPVWGVIEAPVAGTAYKFGMVQGKLNDGKVYYLKGGMSGYYMATTTNVDEAIDVYLEATEGGYYLYAMINGTKTYINMVVSGTHVNGAYEANASTVYTYDADNKTVIATVNDAPYWFGTRNDNTYTTVGPCATSYNGFYCQFYGETAGETPDTHEHNFVNGKCECGATDPTYQPPHEHTYVDGKCECGAEDPNYQPPSGGETPEAPVWGVIEAPVAGTAYKFGMVQGKLNDGNVYYLKGGMSGYYMATTTNVDEAIDVYLEATEGGYYLYAMINGTKTYINMVVSGTHVNGAYEATASTVYTYDADSKTVIATVNDAPYWFGTRNDNTYTTVGPCATSYNGFYCQFYGETAGETPDTHEHNFVEGKCECGAEDPNYQPPHEHNFVDGKCECGAEDPDYVAPEAPVVGGGSVDFNTIVTSNPNGDSSYTKTFTTTNGWIVKNSAIQCGGPEGCSNPQFHVIGPDNTYKAICLVGHTSNPGSLTSPTLVDGVSKIVISYTKMFTDTALSVTITVTDSNGNKYTDVLSVTLDKNDKYNVYTYEWVLETPVTGDFTIEIVNNCPTAQAGNKDRITILDLTWEGATTGETPAPHEHNFVEGKCECGETDPNYQPPHEHNFVEGKCECGAEDPNYQPPTGDGVMSIPEVLASAEGTAVVVKGTVSEIYQAWNDQYGNISFYIVDEAGNRLLIFRTSTLVGIGDQVTVTGTATLYNQVIQIAQGGVTVIDVAHVCSTFTEGSCIADTLCTVCGKVGTPAPGHNFVDGTCSVCGEAAPTVEQITASKTIKELITALGWTSSTTKQSFNLDDIVSVKIDGGSNTGKAYNGDHIRIYASDSPAGTMTITVPEGYELVSIKVSAQTGTYAFFNIDGVSGDVCNKTIEVDGNSVVLKSVKNGSDGKQVRVTAIEVVYQPVA